MPYRIASPPLPEPPGWEEAYAADLQARVRRKLITTSGLCLVGVVASVVAIAVGASRSSAPASRRAVEVEADATASLEAAHARASNEQARFEHGVRAAIGDGVAPRPDLGSCPVSLATDPTGGHAFRGVTFPLLVLERTEIGKTIPSQAIAGFISDIRRAEAHADALRFEEASLYARALARPDRLTQEVVFVTTAWTRPRVESDDSYQPGAIAGRAYLYDFATGTVICAADVHAESSRTVGFSFTNDGPIASYRQQSLGAYIDEDLRIQLARAIATNLTSRAAPPPH